MFRLPNLVARIATRSVAVLSLLILPLLAHAATVTGLVTDQQTHQPVAGVSVTAEGAHARAITDESGHFTLTSTHEITHLVLVRLGYERKVVAVADAAAIELVATPLEQQGLEVTGRAIEHAQIDHAQAGGTLKPADLRRASGLSLENSINTLPGVFMQSRTPWGGAHIQIRGYYPNFSQNSNGYGAQIYLNDIPITDASGFTVNDDVDFSALGRVDVINGPSSSRYGQQIAGTINYQTSRPDVGERSLSQMLVGGSDGLFRTSSMYALGTETTSLLVGYGHQTYDSFRPNSHSRKDFASFTGDFKSGPNQTISTYFSYNNSFEQLAGEIDLPDFLLRHAIDNPVYEANHSMIAIESERAGLTHMARIDENFDTRSTVFLTTQAMRQPFAHGYNDFNRFSFGARSALNMKLHVGSVPLDGVAGGSFQRTNYTLNGVFFPTLASTNRPTDQENYALQSLAFTEWNVTLPGAVIATVGGALGVQEFGLRNMLTGTALGNTNSIWRRAFDPTLTPRASLLKKLGDVASVYASYGTGYTPPSLTSFLNSDNTVNKNLKPESANQTEVGSKGLLWRKRISYSVALFDLEISDKLVSQRIGTVSSTTNVGKQRNRGSELSLSALLVDDPKGLLSRVRPWMSWTYSDFSYVSFKSDNNNNAATVNFSGRSVARVPKHVMNLGLDLESRCGGYLFASYQHVDRMYVTFDNSTYVPAYRLINGKLGWKKNVTPRLVLDLSAGGDNLSGSTYPAFIFIGPNYAGLAQAKDGGTGDGYIIPAPYDANVYATARASFSF